MRPRWKGKKSEAAALADPMSGIVAKLQSSLIQSQTRGLLLGYDVLLETRLEQTNLLNQACFGLPIVTADTDKQWFQLSLEEAFYLCHSLKCLEIVGDDKCPNNDDELWECMKSKKKLFPYLYKAYSHLRAKNWVVRSGSQYGADFVVYCHHPSLVHSEYVVLVLAEGDDDGNGRLRVWSDFHCMVRLGGTVAKTLLVLNTNKNDNKIVSTSCLEKWSIDERTITRWSPQQCREDQI